jgi:hypothetical protein
MTANGKRSFGLAPSAALARRARGDSSESMKRFRLGVIQARPRLSLLDQGHNAAIVIPSACAAASRRLS